MPQMPWRLTALFLLMALLMVVPQMMVVAVGLNFVVWAMVAAIRLSSLMVSLRRPRAPPNPAPTGGTPPRVTIHVPIHSEPPEIVNATLGALSRLDWDDYEVICLDNNTSDPRLWKPVRDQCEKLGPRFRFDHVEDLEGAKAGALERALSLSDPDAELVAVVDADYQVRPDFLHRAWTHFDSDRELAFVQFPQAYRDTDEGLGRELAHYFDVFMPGAEASGAALLTGTMSVIRRDALEAAGGWSARTITEDAELGVRLLAAGMRGRFDPEIVGRGVMPADLPSLRSQRRRWVRGNSDTLLQLGARGLVRLGLRRGAAVLGQLTAWFNFLLLPLAVLAAVAIVGLDSPAHRLAAVFAGISIIAQLSWKALLLAAAPAVVVRRGALGRKLLAHFGLSWEGATAWLERLAGSRLGFVRTSKLPLASSVFGDATAPLICAAVAALSAPLLAARDLTVAAVGAALVALAFASVLELHRQLGAIGGARQSSSFTPLYVRGQGDL